MKERPILYSGEMIRAILEWRKSQTRRAINHLLGFGRITDFHKDNNRWYFRNKRGTWNDIDTDDLMRRCPYGVPGDKLWARETFCYSTDLKLRRLNGGDWGNEGGDYKRLPCPRNVCQCGIDTVYYRAGTKEEHTGIYKWRPSIHMPRWASRITQEITDVRVEQVQDISEEDAVAEGFEPSVDRWWEGFQRIGGNRVSVSVGAGENGDIPAPEWMECAELVIMDKTAKDNFLSMWNHLYFERGYGRDVNPWAWAITSKVVKS